MLSTHHNALQIAEALLLVEVYLAKRRCFCLDKIMNPHNVAALRAVTTNNASSLACSISKNRRNHLSGSSTFSPKHTQKRASDFKIRTPKQNMRSLRGRLRAPQPATSAEEISAHASTAGTNHGSSPCVESTQFISTSSPNSDMSSPAASADCSPVHTVPNGARNVRVCMAPTGADTTNPTTHKKQHPVSNLARASSMDRIMSTIPTPKAAKKGTGRSSAAPRGGVNAAPKSASGTSARARSLARQRSDSSIASSSSLSTPSKGSTQSSRIQMARSRSASRLALRGAASGDGCRTPRAKPPLHVRASSMNNTPVQLVDDEHDMFRADLGVAVAPGDISSIVAAAQRAAATAVAAGTPRAASMPRARSSGSTPAFDSLTLCDEDLLEAESAVAKMGEMPQAKLMQALMMLKLQVAKREQAIVDRDAEITQLRSAAQCVAEAPPLPPSSSTATPSKRRAGGGCHTATPRPDDVLTRAEHDAAMEGVRIELQGKLSAAEESSADLTSELLALKQHVADADAAHRKEAVVVANKQQTDAQQLGALNAKVEALVALLGAEQAATRQLQASQVEVEAQLQAEQAQHARSQARCVSLQTNLEAEQAAVTTLTEQVAHAQQCQAVAEQNAARLQAQFDEVDAARRALQEEVLDLKGAVRVMVRVRPRIGAEQGRLSVGGAKRRRGGAPAPAKPTQQQQLFAFPNATEEGVGPSGTAELKFIPPVGSVSSTDSGASSAKRSKGAAAGTSDYNFNAVFPPTAGNSTVFNQVQQIVSSVLDGKRGCVFAYGQTGSGKTHTMLAKGGADDAEAGMIPQAVAQVFQRAAVLQDKGWSVRIEAEMLEIYNETVRDLLAEDEVAGTLDIKLNKNTGQPHVPGLSVVPVSCWAEVTSVLARAEQARATSATQSNEVSSRSHCVFTLRVFCDHAASGQSRAGVLNLVDLAGSERVAKSGASGTRLKETQAINKSLSALGMVLAGLASKARHVPYRDSKLTYLLQPYLADTTQCRTLMIATVSPCAGDAHETHCTLRFAAGVAAITAKRLSAAAAAAGAAVSS